MAKKITESFNYIIVTDSSTPANILFEAPKYQTVFRTVGPNQIKLYKETATDNYEFIELEIDNTKDSDGAIISDLNVWLKKHTGANESNTSE